MPYAGSEEAMRWADELAAAPRPGPDWVRPAVGRAQFLPTVARLMQPAPAGTPKNWRVYRSRFIDPVRIAAGVKFWQDNQATLERAEQEYGVPPEIIVGIIGVETIYGQQMGNFRVIDALATLAFNFPESPSARGRAQRLFPRRTGTVPGAAGPAQGATRWGRWAATPAPWACRSSCRAAGRAGPWISTATAASTWPAARPT